MWNMMAHLYSIPRNIPAMFPTMATRSVHSPKDGALIGGFGFETSMSVTVFLQAKGLILF